MPADPFTAMRNWDDAERNFRATLASEPLLTAADVIDQMERARQRADREAADLDEWRTTYGRLDIPVSLPDLRPVAYAAAIVATLLLARKVTRHGG